MNLKSKKERLKRRKFQKAEYDLGKLWKKLENRKAVQLRLRTILKKKIHIFKTIQYLQLHLRGIRTFYSMPSPFIKYKLRPQFLQPLTPAMEIQNSSL